MIGHRIVALLVVACMTLVIAPRVAQADDVADEAELHFQIATEKYQAGDFRAALEHFLASNRLVPNRNVLFDIARAYEALKQFPDAYRYYVRAASGETDAAAKTRIDDALRRVGPNVGLLKVVTDPPNATLYLDRKDLGQRGTGSQTLGLAAGTYTVIVEAPGYEDAVSQPTDVRIGATASVVVKLVRIVGKVHVVGDDAKGAAVRVDGDQGAPVCIAPCDLDLAPGRHELHVTREGFKPYVAVVDVVANKDVISRPSIEAKTGTLIVSSDEPGAAVEVDGFARGATPALLALPVGTHEVRVSLHGFRTATRSVVIAADRETRLDNVPLVAVEEVEAASRTAEALEDAPASVTVIGSRELRGMAYPTVWQALGGVRGVYLSYDHGYDTAGFRGFGRPGDYGNRTLVLLNGQPMNDNWVWSSYIGYDFRTDIEDVERIEVVRGPGSVLYGTGAFSGVINVVTRPHDAVNGYEVGASTADGTVGRARLRASYDLGGGAGVWTSFAAGHSSGTGLYFSEYANDPATHGQTSPSVDRFDVGTWTGQFWWKALTVQWSYNSHDKHLPTGQFNTILGDDRTRQTDTRGMLEAKFEPKLSSTFQSISRAHVDYYKYTGYFAGDPEIGGLSTETYTGLWAGVEERFVYTPAVPIRVTFGGELQNHFMANQYVESEIPVAPVTQQVSLDDHRSFQVGAGYAVADASLSQAVKLSVGGRYDGYTTFGHAFSPRVALIMRPYDGGNIKVMFGKAFRAPSVYELYFQTPGSQIASPNLRPESMYSAEIEYSHRFAPTITGLVSVYENVIEDLIAQQGVLDPQAGVQVVQYANTTTPVATMGAEAELRREWKDGWMASVSYSFARSVYLKDSSLGAIASLEHEPTRREVPNAPENLASLRAGAPILGRALMAMTRFAFTGSRYDIHDVQSTMAAPQPPQEKTNPALVWDLMLSGVEPRWHIRYSLGAYNLFGWRYTVPLSAEYKQDQIVQNGRTIAAAGYVDF
jgi:outer membrane receptor protein involved in Fe transport